MDSSLGFLVVDRSVVDQYLTGDEFNLPADVIGKLIVERDNPDVVLFNEMFALTPLMAIFPEMTAQIVAEQYWEVEKDKSLAQYNSADGLTYQVGESDFLSIMVVS
jgi:hypothetical protein